MHLPQRLVAKIHPEPNTGCWLWSGMTNGKYPLFKQNKKNVYVHRLVCEQAHGLPDGMFALHRCDMPLCVNPDHLYPGSHEQNMRDMVERGRSGGGALNPQRGSERYNAKITEEDAAYIRNSDETGVALSQRFGLSRGVISQIKSGKRWRHA